MHRGNTARIRSCNHTFSFLSCGNPRSRPEGTALDLQVTAVYRGEVIMTYPPFRFGPFMLSRPFPMP